MNIIAILMPVLVGIICLLCVVLGLLSVVRSRRQMNRTAQMFDQMWNQTQQTSDDQPMQTPVSDMIRDPFNAVNQVFASVAQQIEADNQAPREQVTARVLSRRQSFYGHHHASTSYYVTFELENGDRMELHLPGREYGLLVEGDEGCLTYQGSRFVSFERFGAPNSYYP